MKFVIGVASNWYCHDYTMKQLKKLRASEETWAKNSLESFETEFTRIKSTVKEYTDIPLELKEVNYLIKYVNGDVEKRPVVRHVATIGSLKQLVELSKNCNIIIDYDHYDIPYIKFYNSYIE